jgi:hypothetical protein
MAMDMLSALKYVRVTYSVQNTYTRHRSRLELGYVSLWGLDDESAKMIILDSLS